MGGITGDNSSARLTLQTGWYRSKSKVSHCVGEGGSCVGKLSMREGFLSSLRAWEVTQESPKIESSLPHACTHAMSLPSALHGCVIQNSPARGGRTKSCPHFPDEEAQKSASRGHTARSQQSQDPSPQILTPLASRSFRRHLRTPSI